MARERERKIMPANALHMFQMDYISGTIFV